MTTGYRISDGTDLASLFTSSPASRSAIGYRTSDGTDLNSLFHPYTIGAKRAATGFRNSAGVDFADLWQNSSVPLFTWTAISQYSEGQGIYDPPYTDVGGEAGIRYNTDGTTTLTSNTAPSSGTNWGSGGPFTDKYVRCSSYSGDAPGGLAVGTWYQLNANRSWYIVTANGTGIKGATLTIDFSDDGSNVDHTVSVELFVASG